MKFFSTATKKSYTMDTTYEHILKIYLSLNKYRSYHSGEYITYHDIKKKNRTGGQFISGRHFHDMEKLGIKCYKKARSYCAHKYDLKMCSVNESGTSIEYVIIYVRQRMYHHLVTAKKSGMDPDSDLEGLQAQQSGTLPQVPNA